MRHYATRQDIRTVATILEQSITHLLVNDAPVVFGMHQRSCICLPHLLFGFSDELKHPVLIIDLSDLRPVRLIDHKKSSEFLDTGVYESSCRGLGLKHYEIPVRL